MEGEGINSWGVEPAEEGEQSRWRPQRGRGRLLGRGGSRRGRASRMGNHRGRRRQFGGGACRRGGPVSGQISMNLVGERLPAEIPYQALVVATDNFSEERIVGSGGFGKVYKGFLRDRGIEVAIKRLSEQAKQGTKEFLTEVNILSQLRHRNVAKLIGWSHERKTILLVYEFLPNGSLDRYIFDGKSQLAWPARCNIVLGLADALLYLHEECEQWVRHGDVKTSNVMLDERFDAILGDFGLAELVNHDIGSWMGARIAGTFRYMAPEYVLDGQASRGTDVYGFGVVMLETACGLSCQSTWASSADEGRGRHMWLVEWVWELYRKGAVLEAADRRLGGDYDRRQMERGLVVGLWCTHPDVDQRPSIRQARHALLHPETVPLPFLPVKMPRWWTAERHFAPNTEVTQLYTDQHSSTTSQMNTPSSMSSLSASRKPSCSFFTGLFSSWRRARNPRKVSEDEIRMETEHIRMGSGLMEFSYDDLYRATRGFAPEKKLGESRHCVMYKASLMSSRKEAAVRRFLQPHGQGKQWYIGEMMTLSHLAHRNLVKLIGWCQEGDEFLLVVEYTANGSLDRHLFGGSGHRAIPWDVRYKVAIGVASALSYLHDWGLCVLHRDIKSENVMLDEKCNAKLGGFAFSRVVDHDNSSLMTTVVAGTMGYMAPECAISRLYTKESDVYSFGVVALEIACGRKTMDAELPPQERHLVQWVQSCYQHGRLLHAADPKLQGSFNAEEMERLMLVGLWCTNYESSRRPQMAKTLRALQFKECPPPRIVPEMGKTSASWQTSPPSTKKPKTSTSTSTSTIHTVVKAPTSISTRAQPSIMSLAGGEQRDIIDTTQEHMPRRHGKAIMLSDTSLTPPASQIQRRKEERRKYVAREALHAHESALIDYWLDRTYTNSDPAAYIYDSNSFVSNCAVGDLLFNEEIESEVIDFFTMKHENKMKRQRDKYFNFACTTASTMRLVIDGNETFDERIRSFMFASRICEQTMNSLDMIFSPMFFHSSKHWSLLVVDFIHKEFQVYDSLYTQYLRPGVKEYIEVLDGWLKLKRGDTVQWPMKISKDCPQQSFSLDCALFVCKYIEILSTRTIHGMTFNQDDIPYFRAQLAIQIIQESRQLQKCTESL